MTSISDCSTCGIKHEYKQKLSTLMESVRYYTLYLQSYYFPPVQPYHRTDFHNFLLINSALMLNRTLTQFGNLYFMKNYHHVLKPNSRILEDTACISLYTQNLTMLDFIQTNIGRCNTCTPDLNINVIVEDIIFHLEEVREALRNDSKEMMHSFWEYTDFHR